MNPRCLALAFLVNASALTASGPSSSSPAQPRRLLAEGDAQDLADSEKSNVQEELNLDERNAAQTGAGCDVDQNICFANYTSAHIATKKSIMRCPVGKWVHSCEADPPTVRSNGAYMDEEGQCIAESSGEGAVRAKVTCGATRTKSVGHDARWFRDGTLVNETCDSPTDLPISCNCYSPWGAANFCGGKEASHFIPTGMSCTRLVPKIESIRRRRAPDSFGKGVGVKVFVVCEIGANEVPPYLLETHGMASTSQHRRSDAVGEDSHNHRQNAIALAADGSMMRKGK